MTEEPLPIPHKCNIWDYCIMDEEYKLLFCAICHVVVGYEKDGMRLIRKAVIEQFHPVMDQNQYSEETLRDSI